eukprot:12978120-Alexandrium_andersonii.AAC.1
MTAPAPLASSKCNDVNDGPALSKVTATSGQPSPPAVTCGAASAWSSRPTGVCSAATKLAA